LLLDSYPILSRAPPEEPDINIPEPYANEVAAPIWMLGVFPPVNCIPPAERLLSVIVQLEIVPPSLAIILPSRYTEPLAQSP